MRHNQCTRVVSVMVLVRVVVRGARVVAVVVFLVVVVVVVGVVVVVVVVVVSGAASHLPVKSTQYVRSSSITAIHVKPKVEASSSLHVAQPFLLVLGTLISPASQSQYDHWSC